MQLAQSSLAILFLLAAPVSFANEHCYSIPKELKIAGGANSPASFSLNVLQTKALAYDLSGTSFSLIDLSTGGSRKFPKLPGERPYFLAEGGRVALGSTDPNKVREAYQKGKFELKTLNLTSGELKTEKNKILAYRNLYDYDGTDGYYQAN